VGAVHLPLSDWSDFSGEISDSYYQKKNPNIYYGLSLNYALGKHHSLNLGTELIKTSASLSSVMFITNYNYLLDTLDVVPLVIRWEFQGIPVTLGYEYKLSTFNQRFSPVVGIGASYFISEVEAEVLNISGSPFISSLPKEKRTGRGYGFHASLGLISQLTESFSMISQVRYRFSDGMGFTDKKDAIKVEFTGFDFSVGIGWNF
jgi:outer membrane protein W